VQEDIAFRQEVADKVGLGFMQEVQSSVMSVEKERAIEVAVAG